MMSYDKWLVNSLPVTVEKDIDTELDVLEQIIIKLENIEETNTCVLASSLHALLFFVFVLCVSIM
jgi:hypothetical protein